MMCVCPLCHKRHRSGLQKREMAFFLGMFLALKDVYFWCLSKNRHEFKRAEVLHLIGKYRNATERFGDFAYAGGLCYKQKTATGKWRQGYWGLVTERCDRFFRNEISVPTAVWKDPVTGELTPANYKFLREMPDLVKLLGEDGEYRSRYATEEQLTL